MRGTPSPRLSGAFLPRKGAMPHSGAARGLGQGPVGGRLSEQQRLPQQPQVLAAGLRAQRGVRGCPAEAPGACSRPPWQRLPGRGPAPLEGSPPGPGAPPHGTWRPEPPEPPACPFHPHPIRSESTGLASLPPAWVCLLAKGKQRGNSLAGLRGLQGVVLASVRSLSPFPPMRMGGPGVLGHRVWQAQVASATCLYRHVCLTWDAAADSGAEGKAQVLREGPEGLGAQRGGLCWGRSRGLPGSDRRSGASPAGGEAAGQPAQGPVCAAGGGHRMPCL